MRVQELNMFYEWNCLGFGVVFYLADERKKEGVFHMQLLFERGEL